MTKAPSRVRGGAVVVVLAVWCSPWRGGLFGGDFSDGGAGGGFVDDCFVRGVGRDEGLQGKVVHGAWQSSAGLVDEVGGVVAEQLVAAADQLEVMCQVVPGLGVGHAGQRVAQRDPLVQGGEAAEFDQHAGGEVAA